jgi:hypothetical protein
MSLEETIRNQPPFDVLPTWRKSVIICCIGMAVVTGALTFNRDMNIYGGAPDHPVVTTGQIFPVSVNHGSTRYVTQREKDSFDFWAANAGLLVGGPFLPAFFIWITYRPRLKR